MYGYITFVGHDGIAHQRSFDAPEALTSFAVDLLDQKIHFSVYFC